MGASVMPMGCGENRRNARGWLNHLRDGDRRDRRVSHADLSPGSNIPPEQ
ncbi:hypothetical protein [Sodalinema gerasimenkoae]|nr:hypothetical protein [Sodalinema gerasimenkoae]